MNDDTDLNTMLNKRSVPPPSSNLASRIMEAARAEHKTPLIQSILRDIADMLILPKPAYALAACLVIGLVLGMQIEFENAATTTQDLFSFVEIEEGDWL